MGLFQIGSTQGQGGETQRNFRRQLGQQDQSLVQRGCQGHVIPKGTPQQDSSTVEIPLIFMEIPDCSRRIWVCPSTSKGAGVSALLGTHHWTTFLPSPLMEKVLDLGVR